jgi:hypothetical protein
MALITKNDLRQIRGEEVRVQCSSPWRWCRSTPVWLQFGSMAADGPKPDVMA